VLAAFLNISMLTQAQISGTHTINPSLPANYSGTSYNFQSIHDVLNHPQFGLNTVGTTTSGVTYLLADGVVFNESNLILRNGGSASGWVNFVGNVNNKPTIKANAGQGNNDAVFTIYGADYVKFEGISVEDNLQANSTPTTNMEYGFVFLRVGQIPNASQYITIKNCDIKLKGGSSAKAIAVVNLDENFALTQANSVSGAAGNLLFQNNYINGVEFGYYFDGTSTKVYNDHHITVRGGSVINFGGSNRFCSGVYAKHQQNFEVDSLTINNKLSAAHNGKIAAIWVDKCEASNIKISNNLISIHAITDSLAYGIYNVGGTASNYTANGNTVEITNNTIQNCYLRGSNQHLALIFSGAKSFEKAPDITLISNNLFTNNVLSKREGFAELLKTNAGLPIDKIVVNHNEIYSNKIVLDSSGAGRAIYNDFSSEAKCYQASFNTIDSFEVVTKNGSLSVIYNYGNLGDSSIITSNSISNIKLTAMGMGYTHVINSSGKSTVKFKITNNIIVNVLGGRGYLKGIYVANNRNGIVAQNQLSFLENVGSDQTDLTAIEVMNSAIDKDEVFGNKIHHLNSSGWLLYGIHCATERSRIYNNELFNFINSSSIANAVGIHLNNSSAQFVYNNFVSDLHAPNSNEALAVKGLSTGFTTKGSGTRAFLHNTVYLNAQANQPNFGSAALHTTMPSNFVMCNNILVNKSAHGSTGRTIAFSVLGTSFETGYFQSISNNNNFYGGTPSNNNLIFYNVTNAFSSLADFKQFTGGVESNSISTPFVFVNDSIAPYDLHLLVSSNNQAIKAGRDVSSMFVVASDFDNDTRNQLLPDIGADEIKVLPSGLGELKDIASLSVAPNPTKDMIKITLNDTEEKIDRIEVFNILGNRVFTQQADVSNQLSVDMGGLTNGIYIITITTNAGGKYSQKVMKL
jgi:hypothetical protein